MIVTIYFTNPKNLYSKSSALELVKIITKMRMRKYFKRSQERI